VPLALVRAAPRASGTDGTWASNRQVSFGDREPRATKMDANEALTNDHRHTVRNLLTDGAGLVPGRTFALKQLR
jgi:hypothetical protein